MLTAEINTTVYVRPTVFFTLRGQPRSENVLTALQGVFEEKSKDNDRFNCVIKVFYSPDHINEAIENGELDPNQAVVLFDGDAGINHFRPVAYGRNGHSMPIWARGTKWGTIVGTRIGDGNTVAGLPASANPRDISKSRALNCAQQIAADFGERYTRIRDKTLVSDEGRPITERVRLGFEQRLDLGQFPWGTPRRGEAPPSAVTIPNDITDLVKRLNSGPDLLSSVASDALRKQLPPNSRISWKRIPPRPAHYPAKHMLSHLEAVAAFERACAKLSRESAEVRDALLAGVILDSSEPSLADCYLNPHFGDSPVHEWSVRRPDMHINGQQLTASENDEMPGGFTDLVHIDLAYGINTEQWRRAWDFLFERGPLLFVVSDGWSAGYIESTRWLVGHLRERGLPAHLVTSDHMDAIDITNEGVFIAGERVGTVWRQFPIFETKGKLAQLVYAAQNGLVRMVPEFAHFGNKTWFSLYRMHHTFFEGELTPEQVKILDQLLPDSHLVRYNEQNFPCTVGGVSIKSFAELRELSADKRAKLVLKVTGANDHAARSYGVFIGYARSHDDWKQWLDDRLNKQQPFILQEVFETSVETIAVLNTVTSTGEVFRCKVLLRPWVVNGELVSSHNCCTPHWTTKTHGMVDMAVQPVVYTDNVEE